MNAKAAERVACDPVVGMFLKRTAYELFADADKKMAEAAIEEASRLMTEADEYLKTAMRET